MGLFTSKISDSEYLDGPFSYIPLKTVYHHASIFEAESVEKVARNFWRRSHYKMLSHTKPLDIKPFTPSDILSERLLIIRSLKNPKDIDLVKKINYWSAYNDYEVLFNLNSWFLKYLKEWEKVPENSKKNAELSQTVAWHCTIYKDWREMIIGQETDIKKELEERKFNRPTNYLFDNTP